MLNIISKSIYNKEIRGPKKVVDNLIKGLEIIGYPYVINQRLDATKRLWIHDDINAFKKISRLPSYVHIIAGPNLFIEPEEIPVALVLPRTIYLQPSENIKKIWIAKGYNKSPTEIWPAGIDTLSFKPITKKRERVLVYFKQREQKELDYVTNSLKNLNLDYDIIKYGSYNEKQYKDKVNESRYIIWLGCFESQGVALEEALALNIPILVINKESQSEWYRESTSAPYFDEKCGIRIRGFESLSEGITIMERQWKDFNPRKYIEENLGLAKQARDMLNLFERHFNLSFEDGLKERVIRIGKWRNATLWYRAFVFSKDIAKRYFRK